MATDNAFSSSYARLMQPEDRRGWIREDHRSDRRSARLPVLAGVDLCNGSLEGRALLLERFEVESWGGGGIPLWY